MTWEGANTYVKLWESKDGVTWDWHSDVVNEPASNYRDDIEVGTGWQYTTIIDCGTKENATVGQQFYLYCANKPYEPEEMSIKRWTIDLTYAETKFVVLQDFENTTVEQAFGDYKSPAYSAEITDEYSVDGEKSLKVTKSDSEWSLFSVNLDTSKINLSNLSTIIMYLKLPETCTQGDGTQIVTKMGVIAGGKEYASNDLGKIFDSASNSFIDNDYSYGNKNQMWISNLNDKEIAVVIPVGMGYDKTTITSVFMSTHDPMAGEAIYVDRIVGVEGKYDGSTGFVAPGETKFVVLQDFENTTVENAFGAHKSAVYSAEITDEYSIDGSKSLKVTKSDESWGVFSVNLDTSKINLSKLSTIIMYLKLPETCTQNGGDQVVAQMGVLADGERQSTGLGEIFDVASNSFIDNDYSSGTGNTMWITTPASNREIAVVIPVGNDFDKTKITSVYMYTHDPMAGEAIYVDRIVGVENAYDNSLGFVPAIETKFTVLEDFENVTTENILGPSWGTTYNTEISTDYAVDGTKSLKVTKATGEWGYLNINIDISKIKAKNLSTLIFFLKTPDVCAQNGGDQLVAQFGVVSNGNPYHSNNVGQLYDVKSGVMLETDYSFGNKYGIWMTPGTNQEIAVIVPLDEIKAEDGTLDKSGITAVFMESAEPVADKAIYIDRIVAVEGAFDGSLGFVPSEEEPEVPEVPDEPEEEKNFVVLEDFENADPDKVLGPCWGATYETEISKEYSVDGKKSLKVTKTEGGWAYLTVNADFSKIDTSKMSAVIMFIKTPDVCAQENGSQLVAQFGVVANGNPYHSNNVGQIYDVKAGQMLSTDYSFGNKYGIWVTPGYDKEIGIVIPLDEIKADDIATHGELDKSAITSVFMASAEPIADKAIYIDRIVGIVGEFDGSTDFAKVIDDSKYVMLQDFENTTTNEVFGTHRSPTYSGEITSEYAADGEKSLKVTSTDGNWGVFSVNLNTSRLDLTKLSTVIMYLKLPETCTQNGGDQIVAQFGVLAEGERYSTKLGKIFDVATGAYIDWDYSQGQGGNMIWFNPANNREIAVIIPLGDDFDKTKITSVFMYSHEPMENQALYVDRIIGVQGEFNEEVPPAVLFNGFEVENDVITNIDANTTVADLLKEMKAANNANVQFENTVDSKVGTGATVTFTVDGEEKTYSVLIEGDVTGDGEANVLDLIQMRNDLLNKINLDGLFKTACDSDSDGYVSIIDLLNFKKELFKA
ncbi:MAG: hypothetical protein E7480_02625 [Ruminococcaceae bacterium]|nr:hypothetical protein [Oscillospiraceae bacterium]